MSKTRATVLLLTGWLLTGCGDNSVQVDFATDPGILRGTWLGADEDATVSFDFAATYTDKTHYGVDGTATFENGDVAPVSGTVYGFRTAYLSAQSSVLPVSETFLADIGGATPRQLCVRSSPRGLEPVTYSGITAPPGSFRRHLMMYLFVPKTWLLQPSVCGKSSVFEVSKQP